METNNIFFLRKFSDKGRLRIALPPCFRFSFILSVSLVLIPFFLSAQSIPDHSTESDFMHQSEEFWESVDFVKFKRDIGQRLKISPADLDLFYRYLDPFLSEDRVHFFSNAPYGAILPSEYESYINGIKEKYIAKYPEFLENKESFIQEITEADNQLLAVNGPCTNIGFESGNLNGWTAQTGTACSQNTCNFTTTRNPGCNIAVTETGMTDPWIPGLSPVAPGGGNNSVRIGNFQNGQGLARIQQTFMVTPTNNVFTYKYAVVLEDPRDGHRDNQRPYFEVMMYDGSNREIECATYTRIAATTYLSDYINAPVDNPNLSTNSGCPYGGGGNRPDDERNLWYKDWTTVSIPLVGYEGQNVTIVFTASDCSLGGHLGYAYVDAECSSMTPLNTVTICGNQTVNYTATPGFQAYKWYGPGTGNDVSGIVGGNGASRSQTVTVNRPGNYRVVMTPFTDNTSGDCNTTQTVSVLENCKPTLTVTMCEGVKGSGTVTNVNLNQYNAEILDYNTGSPKTLISWHRAIPISPGNRVGTPAAATNVTVSNGSRFYALINYAHGFGSDTAVLNFVINPKPNVVFPAIPPACVGSPSFQINGVTPAGGTFSGTFAGPSTISPAGTFNPAATGTYTIKYRYVNANGCADSATQNVVVKGPPTVEAGIPQTVCSNISNISLSGTATSSIGVQWVGGNGTFSPNRTSLNVTYTPTAAEKASASLTLNLTSTGNSPCPEVSDPVTINFVPMPTIDAGPAHTICATTLAVAINQATVTNAPGVSWTASSGSFSPATNINTTYTPTITTGTVTLTVTTTGVTTCPNVSDRTTVTVVPPPTVEAGEDQDLCSDITAPVPLTGSATNFSSVAWTGGAGTWTNANFVNAFYRPTAAEKNSGSVTLTLRANANSPCTSVTDEVVLNFAPTPAVDAGNPQTLCAAPGITFTMNGTGAGTWTGGDGSFSNPALPNAVYTPSATELSNGGTITLVYTSTGSPLCPVVSDNTTITIVLPPTVDADPVPTKCNYSRESTGGVAELNVTVTNARSISWSGGSGPFIPNANRPNPRYIPTLAEKNSGSVTLTVTAFATAPCANVTDNVVVSFVQPPESKAGPDQVLCSTGNPSFTMAGTSLNGTGTWTGGTGTFSDPTLPDAVYQPSASEISNGGIITLTYTSVGEVLCPSVADSMTVTLVPEPVVTADIDQTHCATVESLTLSGVASHSSSIVWSGGAGTYSSTDALTTTYTLADSERQSASITFTITANGNSPCQPVTDDLIVNLVQPPTIDAGPDQLECASSGLIFTLNGSYTNAPSGVWTGGEGTLINPVSFNAQYQPSTTELTDGAVVNLIYSTTGTVECPGVSDTMTVTIGKVPTPNAGPDKTVCVGTAVTAEVTPVVSTETYTWTNLQGTSLASGSSVTITAVTDTTLIVTATSDLNCVNHDTMMVIVIPMPIVEVSDTAMCPGQSVVLSGIVSNLADIQMYSPQYSWQKDGTGISGSSDNITVNAGGVYTFTVSAGSCTGSDNAQVTLYPVPVVDLPETIKFCFDDDASFPLDAGAGHTTYSWMPGGESTSGIVIKTPGVYAVTVTNQFSCASSDQTLVRQVCPPRLFVGNAFSPDGDHINDDYTVYHAHVGKYQLLIFNRWGEIIFESRDKTVHWDGMYRGEPMPIGVYAWIITYEGDSEEYRGPYRLEGSVTVVR